jgi:hypothetical protein
MRWQLMRAQKWQPRLVAKLRVGTISFWFARSPMHDGFFRQSYPKSLLAVLISMSAQSQALHLIGLAGSHQFHATSFGSLPQTQYWHAPLKTTQRTMIEGIMAMGNLSSLSR